MCIEVVNPAEAAATQVDLGWTTDPSVHFPDMPATQTLTIAAGQDRHCLTLSPQMRENPTGDTTQYVLQLSSATGGNTATIAVPRDLSLGVADIMPCDVYQDSTAVNCELTDTTTLQTGVPLITTLRPGDSFFAGDFRVEVVEAQGAGVFSGTGRIVVPYLNQVVVNVRFDGITVNEQCQLAEGEVVVEGVGAQVLSEELANALDDLLSTLDDIDNVLSVASQVLNTLNEVIESQDELSSVLSGGWNVLQGASAIGNEYPYLPDSLLHHLDQAILCFLAHPPDTCAQMMGEQVQALMNAINAQFAADYAVRFSPYSLQTHGFDSLTHRAMYPQYNYLSIAGQDYYVPWTSVEAGKTDTLMVRPSVTPFPADLHFEDNQTNRIAHFEADGQMLLHVHGREAGDIHQIYPVQTREDENGIATPFYAGKLNVATYARQTHAVELVQVNGAMDLTEADVSLISQILNGIYEPAVTGFTLTLGDDLSVDGFDNSLDSTGSAIYALYNAEMKTIKGQLAARPDYDPEKYYLLLVGAFEGGQAGFMPKGRNVGFVSVDAHGDIPSLARTIAHELGHGAFVLEHPWETYAELRPGDTPNLMDYGQGIDLTKPQWDRIQDPPLHLAVFDSDEEGESIGYDEGVVKIFPQPNYPYTLYQRCFAPWTRFGHFPIPLPLPCFPTGLAQHTLRNSFWGDNRGFSLDRHRIPLIPELGEEGTVTARMHQYLSLRLNGELLGEEAFSSESLGYANFIAAEESSDRCEPDRWLRVGQNRHTRTMARMFMEGSDPLIVFSEGIVPDIEAQLIAYIDVIQGGEVLYLYLRGIINYKKFPAYEAFIEDAAGNRVFIATFAPEGESHLDTELLCPQYDYNRRFDLKIPIDDNGNFLINQEMIIGWNQRPPTTFQGILFVADVEDPVYTEFRLPVFDYQRVTVSDWNNYHLNKNPAGDCPAIPCEGEY
ncbi:MAG: hypothetical protein R2795_15000 [Saprospiraceae bacterium]